MRNQRRQRGFSLIFGAILGSAFIAVTGLALDTAYVVLCENQLQNATDAAALAGASQVRTSQTAAVTIAQSTAAANNCAQQAVVLASNPSNDAGGDIVAGHYYRPGDASGNLGFYAGVTPYNSVQVNAKRTTAANGAISLFFGPMFYVNTCNITSTATAMIGGTINAGIIALDTKDPDSLSLGGTGSRPKIVVNNTQNPGTYGAVIVNSSSSTGASWKGNPTIDASALYLGGNVSGAQSLLANGTAYPNSSPVPDPLINIPAPAKPAVTSTQVNGVWQAGYYSGTLTGTLGPGIFWVDGGVGAITATQGTMIYINTGGIALGGNSALTITPPTSGTYAGISIFQSRTDTTGMSMKGTSDINNSGVLYLPDANISVVGTPTSVGSMLVAYTITVQGNAQLTVNYNGAFPTQGNSIFLVQ